MSKKSNISKNVTVNIGLVGLKGCGKTAMLIRFYTNRFIDEYSSSIVETVVKSECIEGHNYNIVLKDSEDSDEFYLESILPWADIILNIFSITSRCSYYRAVEIYRLYQKSALISTPASLSRSHTNHRYINHHHSAASLSLINKPQQQQHLLTNRNIRWYLIGAKSDLADLRLVQTQEAKDTAQAHNMCYREVSTIVEHNSIRQMLMEICREYLSTSTFGTNSSASSQNQSIPANNPFQYSSGHNEQNIQSVNHLHHSTSPPSHKMSFPTSILPDSMPQFSKLIPSSVINYPQRCHSTVLTTTHSVPPPIQQNKTPVSSPAASNNISNSVGATTPSSAPSSQTPKKNSVAFSRFFNKKPKS